MLLFQTAEQELAKLQRQYRIMEGDRKAYSEESQNTIRKQRSVFAANKQTRNAKERPQQRMLLRSTKIIYFHVFLYVQ